MRSMLLLLVATLLSANSVWAQATERTIYASVVDKNDAPVTGLSAASSSCAKTTPRARCCASRRRPNRCRLRCWSTPARRSKSTSSICARRCARFFKQMGGKHEIALIGLGERPTVLSDYTRDVARLEKAIGSVFARSGSGTYILEGIVETANGMRRRKAARPAYRRLRRRAVRSSASATIESVLDALRESGATLHTLMLNKPGASMGSREEQELAKSVAEGTEMTGGRRDDLLTTMALTDRMQVARQRAQQSVPDRVRPSLEIGAAKDAST